MNKSVHLLEEIISFLFIAAYCSSARQPRNLPQVPQTGWGLLDISQQGGHRLVPGGGLHSRNCQNGQPYAL